jgi:pilus assembly protein FimV
MGFARHHLALAAALLVASSGAQALGLGKLSVQSALGETMRAEIDVTSLTPEEASTLRVRVAPPEAYRTSGVEYNPVLTSAQVQVVRNNGRTVLRVSSDRSVQEPFVDVILELTWASGRLVREYTLLFDPPSLPKPAPVITAPPAVAAAPTPGVASEAVPAPAPAVTTALPRNGTASAPAVARAPAPVPAPAPVQPRPPATEASEYTVRPGDSLSRIASRTQVSGISLDQMLVGLFRNNPDAFIDGNMNRLKAGSTLQVPGSEALASVPNSQARQIILAQSADFSAYRQRLASAAPTLQNTESERQSKGQVQAAVEDRRPAAAPTPDKLTLSKAGPASAAESKLSKETEKKDAAARVAELTRNVEELKKLSSAAKPAAAVASAAPAAAATPAPALPAPVIAAAEPASVAASAPAPAVAAANAAASKPAARASAPLAPPPVAEPPSFVEQLIDSPVVLPLAGMLVAVLGVLGLLRLRSRRPVNAQETGFHESRLQPDSFFGGTGGQRVDTRDAQNSGQSSMSYSLSQLDAIGDVDPVAEADVYLAYGRDLQAEEILKEALRANPTRLAIRLKLLEVYAKRRDTKGFEQLAVQLYAETKGSGEDWAKAQELGRGIDPDNPLYQPGGAPAHVEDGPELRPEPMNASTLPQTALPAGAAAAAAAAHLATDSMRSGPDTGPVSGFDLALDLDLDAPEPVSPHAMAATQAMPASVEQAPLTMDFDISSRGTRTAPPAPDLNFDLSGMGDLPVTASPAPVASTDLDFDLGEPTQPGETNPDALGQALEALGDDEGDPLMRQLELADEFRQIGDTEGAREVLQELIQRASGPLRDKAQAMLNELR